MEPNVYSGFQWLLLDRNVFIQESRSHTNEIIIKNNNEPFFIHVQSLRCKNQA